MGIGFNQGVVRGWLPVTVPEPCASVILPAVGRELSPQFQTAVCVSSTPRSVNEALTLTGLLTGTGATGAVIAPTVGATLSTVILMAPEALAL